MVGERTPLVSAPGAATRQRSSKRLFYAKIAAGVALVGTLGAVLYSVTSDSSSHSGTTSAKPAMASTSSASTSITEDNWFCGETKYEANYIKLNNKPGDDEYFYWFVPSRSEDPSKDPLVLWLTGGPGGSSMLAMFTENGPCLVDANVTTRWNRYSWTNKANVVWLDQPSGVGFSALDSKDNADYTEADVGPNMWAFLNGFLDKHPEFVGRDFYITGESYAGHYVPGSSHYVWQENKKLVEAGEPTRINLKGIAIGNGLTNPNIQYKYNQDMAYNQYNITLLTEAQIEQMNKDSELCVALVELCQKAPTNGTVCMDAQTCWGDRLIMPFSGAHRSQYDILQECPVDHPDVCDPGFLALAKYFELDVVKKHMPAMKQTWVASSDSVYLNFAASGDISASYHTQVADLLNDGLRVLIYAGDTDLMCNWIGNRAWTLDLEWKDKDGYNKAEEHAFKTQDPYVENAPVVDAGVARQFENFAFVRVYEAGHMVPTNQPAVAWVLLDKFLNGQQL